MRWLIIALIFISGCVSNNVAELEKPADVQKEIGIYNFGQNIFIDDVVYKVTNVETYKEIGKNEVSQKSDGLFYMIYLTVENKGINGYVISPEVKLIDSLGRMYYPNLKSKFYIDNTIKWEQTLMPGKANSGVLVFDVDADSKDFKLEIKNDWKEVRKIYIKIPEGVIVFKGVSEEVVKAREENKLLNASIN